MTDASSDAVLSPSTAATSPAVVGGECSAARPVVGGLPSPSGAENTHVQGAGLTAENHGASGDYQGFRSGDRVRHVSGWELVIDHLWPNGCLAFTAEPDYFRGSAWDPTAFTLIERADG